MKNCFKDWSQSNQHVEIVFSVKSTGKYHRDSCPVIKVDWGAVRQLPFPGNPEPV